MNTQHSLNLTNDLDVTASNKAGRDTSPNGIPNHQMKASRPKATSGQAASKSLTPLRLAHDRVSNLIDEIEPRRQRDELVISPQNLQTFTGLIEEYRHADTLRRHSLPIRSKLLFCGPPGCGKTITAEIFAHELGLPLYVAKLDAIISSFLGETASNLRKLFDEVNRRPCVLFLDEFDALARNRKDDSEHNELRRVVNSLLMMIDRYNGRGFLIAATNLDEALDPAVWRRFDEVILFSPPNDRQTEALIKLKTRNFPITFNLADNLPKLRGLSYADIERVCLNAIKRSILKRSKSVLENEFNRAVRDERRRQAIRAHVAGDITE